MRKSPGARKVWVSVLAAVAVGGAFLLAWRLTHPGLPEGTLVVPRDAATISEALERVSPGGAIALDARKGPFVESIAVRVPGITLRSLGQRAVLRGGKGPVIDVVADGVTLDGLAVREGETGIAVAGAECRVRNVSITSCDVGLSFSRGESNQAENVAITAGRVGMDVAASTQTLRGIQCVSTSDVGIRLHGAVRTVMEDVRVEGAATGISLVDCSGSRLAGLTIARCSRAGLEVLGGSDNVVSATDVRDMSVGVLLRATQSATVHSCRLTMLGELAVDLADARGCRISCTDVRACSIGVRVAGGADHAILDGRFRDCDDAAIDVTESENVLIGRNVILGGNVAISARRSADVQVLRNTVTRAGSCGLLLSGDKDPLVLDNVVHGGEAGAVVASSNGAILQRNVITGSRSVGLTLVNGFFGSMASANRLSGHPIGVLVAGSSRDLVMENEILGCTIGVLLHRVGYGTRVQENRIAENDVGLRWDDGDASPTPLDALGLRIHRMTSAGTPTVSGNAFRANRTYDLEARTDSLLYAGGNTFHGSGLAEVARIAGNVRLPQSTGKETVVVGAGDSPTSRLLGRLLGICLADEGFRVVDMAGFSSDEALQRALSCGDIDAAWSLGDSGRNSFWEISAQTGWGLVATRAVVETQSVAASGTTSGMRVSVAASPGVEEDLTRRALDRAGFVVTRFQTMATADAAEMAVEFGEADIAVVDRIDETLTLAGFRLLEDGGLLPSVPIKLALSATPPEGFRDLFLKLAPRLTTRALHELVSRVRLLHQDLSDVALDFLLREGLIAN